MRTLQSLPVTRWQFLLLTAVAVALTVATTTYGAVVGVSLAQIVGLVVALVAGLSLFLVPAHWLPAIGVFVFVFVPSRFIPNDGLFRPLPPITLVLVVWAFRRVVLRQGGIPMTSSLPPFEARGARLWVYLPSVFLVLWLAYSTLTSRSTPTSVAWSISFLAAVLTPMLVADSRREGMLVRTALMWGGAVLGAYAFVELLLQSSPVYGTLFEILGRSVDRDWSVYRSFASFSHPLFAAAFFTIPAMVALGAWATTGRPLFLVLSGFAILGVFSTVSRGSLVAVAAGSAVVAVCCLFDSRIRARARMLGFGALGIAGGVFALTFAPLQERSDSLEAGLSNDARDLGLAVALKAAAYSRWLGTGPGTSGRTGRIFDDVVIENSILQLLISIGIPGLLTVAALFIGIMVNALSNRDYGTAAATVALTVSFSGFNVIDAVFYMHFLVGILILLSLSSFRNSPLDPHADIGLTQSAHYRTVSVPQPATIGGRSWI